MFEKFERGDESGRSVPESAVDAPDVVGLVGVGDVAAVPGEEDIAFMEGGEGQVHGIALGVIRHDFVLNVEAHEFIGLLGHLQYGEALHQAEAVGSFWFRGSGKFGHHGRGSNQSVGDGEDFPPLTGPLAPGAQMQARREC